MTLKVLDPRLSADGEPARLAPRSPRSTAPWSACSTTPRSAPRASTITWRHSCATRYGVREVIRRRKPDASRPAPAEMLGELRAADAIVSGIGD